MKLNLIFLLIDALVLLAFPFVFLYHKLRQMLGFKR